MQKKKKKKRPNLPLQGCPQEVSFSCDLSKLIRDAFGPKVVRPRRG